MVKVIDPRLVEIVDAEFRWRLAEFPELAASLKIADSDPVALDRIATPEQQRRGDYWQQVLRVVDELVVTDFAPTDQQQLLTYRAWLALQVRAVEVQAYRYPFDPFTHFVQRILAYVPRSRRLRNEQDYQDYLSYLADLPRYLREHIELLRESVDAGLVAPKVVAVSLLPTLAQEGSRIGQEASQDSALFEPFARVDIAVAASVRDDYANQARDLIAGEIATAFTEVERFFRNVYVPSARESVGARDLPNGEDYYRYAIQRVTGLEVDPDEVHRLGLNEVARIQHKQAALVEQLGPNYAGLSVTEVNELLRGDARLRAESREELLNLSRDIATRSHAWSSDVIGTLPTTEWELDLVPAYLEANYVGARYVPAPYPGAKGAVWINAHDLAARPLYSLESLIVHEGSPGHHIHIARAFEGDHNPAVRAANTALIEGWALYVETLAEQEGFYSGPLDVYGKLSNEAWRAARLVVDTGIHHRGWTQRQAEEYLQKNTALGESEVRAEVLRYISWPGQALAYKLGEIEILRLRSHAQKQLGAAFSLTEFHDVLLDAGFASWSAIEAAIEQWIGAHHA